VAAASADPAPAVRPGAGGQQQQAQELAQQQPAQWQGQRVQQHEQHRRQLLQSASGREADAAAEASLSASDEVVFALLVVAGLGMLAFIGWKGLEAFQRSRRPGYVELSDTATFHRPWAVA
jgi:hypothetical protein